MALNGKSHPLYKFTKKPVCFFCKLTYRHGTGYNAISIDENTEKEKFDLMK